MKRKSRKELQAEADAWLKKNGIAPTKEEKADIIDGDDPDLVICSVTGKIFWKADLKDKKRILRYKEEKPWLD